MDWEKRTDNQRRNRERDFKRNENERQKRRIREKEKVEQRDKVKKKQEDKQEEIVKERWGGERENSLKEGKREGLMIEKDKDDNRTQKRVKESNQNKENEG